MSSVWVVGEITDALAERAVRHVEGVAAGEEITVYVDSIGGSVDGAERMAAALGRHGGRTTAILLRADSAALLLTCGADHRVAAADATATIHESTLDVRALHWARAGELERVADEMHRARRRVSASLGRRAGTSPTYFEQFMHDDGRTFDADALRRHGLVDAVHPAPSAEFRQRRWRTNTLPEPEPEPALPSEDEIAARVRAVLREELAR